MTTRQPASPRALRAATTGPVAADLAALSTVHVGHTGILLRTTTGRLLPITAPARGLVPGGLCLTTDDDAADLARAAGRLPVLDLTAWSAVLAAARRTDLVVRPGATDVRAARALWAEAVRAPRDTPGGTGGPMDPRPVRRQAPALVAAAVTGPGTALDAALGHLVGVGPGSTPSGDDVVVGVLAGLDRRGDHGSRAAAERVREALPALLRRTTLVSQHDLRAALHGEVAERVHRLLDATAHPDLVPAVVRQARTWGASSGLDLAAGVAAAVLGTAATASPSTVPFPMRSSA